MQVNELNTKITFDVPFNGAMVTCTVLAEALRHLTKNVAYKLTHDELVSAFLENKTVISAAAMKELEMGVDEVILTASCFC